MQISAAHYVHNIVSDDKLYKFPQGVPTTAIL